MCPGNSPELNPIENLWAIIKNSAYQEAIPKDVNELKARLDETWNSLPLELLQKLFNSFKTKIYEMMTNNGGHTSY